MSVDGGNSGPRSSATPRSEPLRFPPALATVLGALFTLAIVACDGSSATTLDPTPTEPPAQHSPTPTAVPHTPTPAAVELTATSTPLPPTPSPTAVEPAPTATAFAQRPLAEVSAFAASVVEAVEQSHVAALVDLAATVPRGCKDSGAGTGGPGTVPGHRIRRS